MENIKEIRVPSSLSVMTLRDFMAITKIMEETKDLPKMRDKRIVSYYTGDSVHDVDKMPFDEYELILSNIRKCMEKDEPEFIQVFTLDGLDLGFIPNFEKDLTAGEFIDLDTYLQDVQTWHKAMAVLYRPITKVKNTGWFKKRFFYDIAEYTEIEKYTTTEKYSDKMLDMSASIALSAVFFFINLNRQLSIAILQSTREKMTKVKNLSAQQRESLLKTMDGLHTSIISLETTSSNIKQYWS